MGKLYIASLADGSQRIVAEFSMNRAGLFYKMTKVLEEFVDRPSGVSDDDGQDEHRVDAGAFVEFFDRFWETDWLSNIDDSFVSSWARWAAGIVENITLTPVSWIDRCGEKLQVRRYMLRNKELEDLLEQKKNSDKQKVRRSEGALTDIVVRSKS